MISRVSLPAVRSAGYPVTAHVGRQVSEIRVQDCTTHTDSPGPILNAREVTGRAASHVRDVADPQCRVHVQAAAAVIALRNAACSAGIQLQVVSGFRDFERQLAIWTAKFNGRRAVLDPRGNIIQHSNLYESELIDAILTWSALPGASRHHWGTEIDVIDAAALAPGARAQLVPSEFAAGGCFDRLNVWLDSNMGRFGFFRPYATYRGGVQPEPWHLSYAPVSVGALEVLSVEVLSEAIAEADMPGKQTVLARLPQLYERYVLAVDSAEAPQAPSTDRLS
jgi:LAS superfamily LD-carboxypeptidase LdcB